MKKILFVITVDWSFINLRLNLAENAIRDGYEVALITKYTKYKDYIKSKGITTFDWSISRGSLNPINSIISIYQIKKVVKKWNPDLIFSVSMKSVLFSCCVSILHKNISLISAFGGLGFVFSSSSLKAKILGSIIAKILSIFFYKGNNLLILQNDDDKSKLIDLKIVKEKNIRIIRGTGVDSNYFLPKKLSKNSSIVLLPCRILWDKGIREFVEVAKSISNRGVKARFVLVGEFDKENPESIDKKIIEKFVSEGIEYWGHFEDMRKVYERSRIILFPSYREGFPKVLLEAASSSRPIVAFDVPGCKDIVFDRINGILVNFKNIIKLEEAVFELLSDYKKCDDYGRAGRELILKNFSSEKNYRETLKVWYEAYKKK